MLDWTIDLAYRAGALLRAGVEQERQIEYKSRANVVTDIDRASEQLIVAAIRERFPDHRIVSEEGGGIEQDSRYTWLIDPLDGTNNYAHGFPFFSVSLAILENNQPVVGVVYDPMRDELFAAERGSGARCNGRRLQVSSTETLATSLLTTGFPYTRFGAGDNNLAEFTRMLMLAQDIRRPGSAALDLSYVASGRSDGYWELSLSPWDAAAGALILTESGGRLSNWRGDAWDVWGNRIVATNGRIHDELLAALRAET